MWDEIRHFKPEEFDQYGLPGTGKMFMDEDFIKTLDLARELAGIPFTITSGYRNEDYNELIGGVSGSSHVLGLAADIRTTNDLERAIIVRSLTLAGFDRIGINAHFIHVDLDARKRWPRLWLY